MPNIRIKDIPTTASATSSTDFIGIDGSANGTRKLNAYSPTFGGNLTVSGYADLGSGGIGTPAAGHIQVGGSGSYGAAIIGRGSAYDFGLFNKNGDDVIHVATGTTNVAVSGNLTVSGRDLTLGSSESVIYFGTPSSNYLYYNGSSLFLRVGSVDRITIPASTGNFLIGTTTDSSNGKLQLASHTTSAGGIGFGTDTSLYRSQTGMLALDGLTGSLSQLDLRVGGVQKAFVAWNGGDFYLGAVVGTTVIKSSNTTALTLDSSQNATFSGTILASSATGFVLNLSDTRSQAAGNGASIGLRGTYTGSSQTNFAAVLGLKVNSTDGNYAGKMVLQTRPNGGALTDALTLDDSQNATFAGRAAINGTYATVATGNYTLSLGAFSAGTRVNAGLRTDSIGDLDVSAGSGGSLSLNYDTSVPVLCFGNFSIASGKTFKLGNAYVAGAPTATGYVTIQDSAGNTYKVLVGT